jgi:lipid-binding SYLF domain-containing protein
MCLGTPCFLDYSFKITEKKMLKVNLTIIIICIFGLGSTFAGPKEEERIELATEVLTETMEIPEEGIPPALLEDAYGIMVIPGVVKVGFVIAARHGRGVLVVRKKEGGWSNPCFISLSAGSIGWQVGAQATDVVLVFKSRRSVDAITKGKFTLGADASIAAGPVGRSAGAGTDVEFKAEIYSYSKSRGFFAGISLEGASLQIDHKANKAFYDQEDISPKDILYNPERKTPKPAKPFLKTLTKYAKSD